MSAWEKGPHKTAPGVSPGGSPPPSHPPGLISVLYPGDLLFVSLTAVLELRLLDKKGNVVFFPHCNPGMQHATATEICGDLMMDRQFKISPNRVSGCSREFCLAWAFPGRLLVSPSAAVTQSSSWRTTVGRIRSSPLLKLWMAPALPGVSGCGQCLSACLA